MLGRRRRQRGPLNLAARSRRERRQVDDRRRHHVPGQPRTYPRTQLDIRYLGINDISDELPVFLCRRPCHYHTG